MTPILVDSGAILVYVGANFVDFGRFWCDFTIGASQPLSMGHLTRSQLSTPLTLTLSVDVESHAHDLSTCVEEALGTKSGRRTAVRRTAVRRTAVACSL